MKKAIICILICMLMITTTTVIAHPTIRIVEKNLYKNTDGATGSFVDDSWIKTFGGLRADASGSVVQTADGGYIIVGETVSYQSHGYDAWLIKTDSSGNKIWDKTFGGDLSDAGFSVQQTDDSGYIITGWRDNSVSAFDIWLIKTTDNGNEEWNKTFDYGGGNDFGFCVRQTSDGGYILSGHSYDIFGVDSVHLIKTDDKGNTIWDKKLGEKTFPGYSDSIIETPDHSYVVVGSQLNPQNNSDIWVSKINNIGELLWEKTYGGNNHDLGFSLVLTNDENYIVVGSTKSSGAERDDIWLLKISNSGDLEQNKTIGGQYFDEKGYSMKLTNDDGYIIAGEKSRQFPRWKYSVGIIVKLDSDFTTEWTKTFGGIGNSKFLSVQQTTDNHFILTGDTTRVLNFNRNAWLVKTIGN